MPKPTKRARKEIRRLTKENRELLHLSKTLKRRYHALHNQAANLVVERDAADVLLGEAMDALNERRGKGS